MGGGRGERERVEKVSKWGGGRWWRISGQFLHMLRKIITFKIELILLFILMFGFLISNDYNK